MAQVESAVVANELKAPSRWQTTEALAVVHLWPPTVSLRCFCRLAVHHVQDMAQSCSWLADQCFGHRGMLGSPLSCVVLGCWGKTKGV